MPARWIFPAYRNGYGQGQGSSGVLQYSFSVVVAAALSAALGNEQCWELRLLPRSPFQAEKWKVEGGSRYYKTGLGEKLTGLYEIDGRLYAFGDDGALIRPERPKPICGRTVCRNCRKDVLCLL